VVFLPLTAAILRLLTFLLCVSAIVFLWIRRFFLPDPNKDAEENPETFIFTPPKKRKPPKTPTEREIIPGSTGEGPGPTLEPNQDPTPPTPNPIPGPGPGPQPGDRDFSRPTQLTGLRNMFDSKKDNHIRKIIFTPTETCNATLKILASGLDGNELLKVESSDRGAIKKGRVQLDIVSGERTSITIEFDEEYSGPIEVEAIRQCRVSSLFQDSGISSATACYLGASPQDKGPHHRTSYRSYPWSLRLHRLWR